ncbi:hypothetical protein P8629_10830 [Hydrogenovibrio sp. 3SP14C1]|uniref:hypothetical protein n=1 Tax=Hydrogenovibrio sp. 3SP14C1 TaxID=3038774 RepID=UPI00241706D1|nr:hypothetical protein [Hydrogenovibrio sp. 3SP14C1]MDG4813502.1 hypothetical protein [Hydrogenovibrio sp. 3SP14C1]
MKQLTLKALFAAAVAVFSLNAQAAESKYDQCVADGDNIIKLANTKGSEAARAYEQKTTLVECFGELSKIEAKYGDKTVARNPSSVMTADDRAKWAKLFDSIDAKQYRGTPYLQAAYYFNK